MTNNFLIPVKRRRSISLSDRIIESTDYFQQLLRELKMKMNHMPNDEILAIMNHVEAVKESIEYLEKSTLERLNKNRK